MRLVRVVRGARLCKLVDALMNDMSDHSSKPEDK